LRGSSSGNSSGTAMTVAMVQQQWAVETGSFGSTAVAVMVAMAQRNGAAQWSKRKSGCTLADSGCTIMTWAAPKWLGLLSSARLYSAIPSVQQHLVVIFACGHCRVGADQYNRYNEDNNSNVGGNDDNDNGFYCIVVQLPVTRWWTQAKLQAAASAAAVAAAAAVLAAAAAWSRDGSISAASAAFGLHPCVLGCALADLGCAAFAIMGCGAAAALAAAGHQWQWHSGSK
jgi:hypothetical protein